MTDVIVKSTDLLISVSTVLTDWYQGQVYCLIDIRVKYSD
jgi:hypothetical protein